MVHVYSKRIKLKSERLLNIRSGKGCNDRRHQTTPGNIFYLSNIKRHIDLTAVCDNIDREFFFSSIRDRRPSSKSSECRDLAEELYRCTKSYMSGNNQM